MCCSSLTCHGASQGQQAVVADVAGVGFSGEVLSPLSQDEVAANLEALGCQEESDDEKKEDNVVLIHLVFDLIVIWRWLDFSW